MATAEAATVVVATVEGRAEGPTEVAGAEAVAAVAGCEWESSPAARSRPGRVRQ